MIAWLPSTVLYATAAGLAYAHHFKCHWQPTNGVKPGLGDPTWAEWCTASAGKGNGFECGVSAKIPVARNIATYLLDEHVIEIGTPCGKGGYGFTGSGRFIRCASISWLACAEFPDTGFLCYGLDRRDDCSFYKTGKPTQVKIYYQM